MKCPLFQDILTFIIILFRCKPLSFKSIIHSDMNTKIFSLIYSHSLVIHEKYYLHKQHRPQYDKA